MYLITTNSEAPFATGQWAFQNSAITIGRRDPFYDRIDKYGKLESQFNYVDSYKKTHNGAMAAVSSNVLAEYNRISQHEYDIDNGESHIHLDENPKVAGLTERWRQNDKFILVENPLGIVSNNTKQTIVFQHQHSAIPSDDFQFPKVTYIG